MSAKKKTAGGIPGWTPRCAGKSVLFTGKSYRLAQLTALVEAEGGNVVDAVTPKLDYVVVLGRSRGTPAAAKEAQKLNQKQGANITVLAEPDFLTHFSPT